MGKHKQETIQPVNDFITVHPALDFWDSKAIISVGGKWLITYDDGGVEFINRPFCIMSDGDKFSYSKKELALRRLFHSGRVEVPAARWEFPDIENFSNNPDSLSWWQVFFRVREQIQFYMDFDDPRIYDLLATFIIYTYFYPLFNGAPILQLWGEFKTGKTKICSLLDAMCFNPINSANISSASIFRLVESRRAVILLDESEELSTDERAKEIRNMLLAGTGKSGETYRQEKQNDDSYQTQTFKVFSPKVIASIAGTDITALKSRIIRIITTGARDRAKENREVNAEDRRWQEARNMLYRLCLSKYSDVVAVRENLPEHKLQGRTLMMWHGIITLAYLIDQNVFNTLVGYALENKEYIDSEIEMILEEPQEMLQKILELASNNGNITYVPASKLFNELQNFGLTSTKDMAKKLGRYGLQSRNLRIQGKPARYYTIFKDKLQSQIKNNFKEISDENIPI